MSILERIDRPGPKRLLALDGGGIRGLITLEILAEIEAVLRKRTGAGADFVLADFFDYIGGTSTGAIIAAGLSLGMSVEQLRGFYFSQGRAMFGAAGWQHFLVNYRFEGAPLAAALRNAFGASRTLGSEDLRTLLLVVLNNATTDSPWPLSNNPRARYNDRALANCNLELPLWQIVRASTAAPVYFPPEVVQVGPSRFVFQDGGITPYNNPAFLLFLMATSAPYRVNWPTGPDKLLLVSVGTGSVPNDHADLKPSRMHYLYLMGAVPKTLMFSALNHQDLMCRMFGETLAGKAFDKEAGDLLAVEGGSGLPPMFTYVRYNAELTRQGLDELGLTALDPRGLRRMDSVRYMKELATLGSAVGAAQVRPEHFERHLP